MTTLHFKAEQYSNKGTSHCSELNGDAKRTIHVLAFNTGVANFSQANMPAHAHVAQQEGNEHTAKPIAFFTSDQARQLATALHKAADATGDC